MTAYCSCVVMDPVYTMWGGYLRKSPKLDVYLLPHEAYVNVIDMVVRNSGGGPATNITWEVIANETDVKERDIRIQDMALFHVLHYLPAKEAMRFFFGESVKLLKEPWYEAR